MARDHLEEEQIRDRAVPRQPAERDWTRASLTALELISRLMRSSQDEGPPDRLLDAKIEAFLEGYEEVADDGRFVVAWKGGTCLPLGTWENKTFIPNGALRGRYTESDQSKQETIALLRTRFG